MKNKENLDINTIINEIADSVPSNLTTLEKIRYVYIAVGKILSKHTDFFLSLSNKLNKQNLSYQEISDIYNDEKNQAESDTQVICKSAALILKKIYDKLNINSKLVKTFNCTELKNPNSPTEQLDIYHWFLAAEDEENTYFLTLAADLPFIQNGFKTEHFATNIPYINESGNQNYEGSQINNKYLSTTEIEALDKKIGYKQIWHEEHNNISEQYSNYAFEIIRRKMTGNSLYLLLEEEQTDFYKSLIEFTGENNKHINLLETPLNSLTHADWNILKNNICTQVQTQLLKKLNINQKLKISNHQEDYQQWLKDLAILISLFIKPNYPELNQGLFEIYNKEFVFTEWSRKIKKELKKQQLEIPNELEFLTQVNSLITKINNYENATNQKEKNDNAKHLSNLFHQVAYHFLDDECIEKKQTLNNGYVSSNYIARKFTTVFPFIFSCGTIQPFNEQSYSEQIVIIKKLLPEIFPELTFNNCHQMTNYDEVYRPVDNRIQIYPLRHKTTGNYSILFNIVGSTSNDEDYYYFYNLQTNELEECDYIRFQVKNSEYQIASNRLKSKLKEIEDIEKPIQK